VSHPFDLPDGLAEAIRQSQNVVTPEMLRIMEASRPSAAQLALIADAAKAMPAVTPEMTALFEAARRAEPTMALMTRELSRAAQRQFDLIHSSGLDSLARDLTAASSRFAAAFDEPGRAIRANFDVLSAAWTKYDDVASRSLAADLTALTLQPLGARFGLDPVGATVLGLRTTSFVSKSEGTTGLPRTSAALQVRAVRTLSTAEPPTSAPSLVEDAKTEIEDRLPDTLRTLGLTDALKALEELRALTPADLAKGGTISRRGWIVQQRTLIEDLAKRATPEIPRRRQVLDKRFQALKASGHPKAVTIDKDWSSLEQLLNSLHAPAHELRVTSAEAAFTVIATRAEVLLQIVADILLSRSGN
jgi:hypothetical protein